MAVYRLPAPSESYRYYVYALFCQDDAGSGYVKFGLSRRIDARLSQLSTACPLPIKMVALLEVKTEDRQRRVERALHERFKGRKLRGEWFAFDFSSQDDKREFNEGCRSVFFNHLQPVDDEYWGSIDCAQLDAINQERRQRFMRLPERYKRMARRNAERRRPITCR